MILRPANVADARNVAALIEKLGGSFAINPDGSGAENFWRAVSETSEAAYITSPRYSFTLAVTGGNLAGFIAMRDTSHIFHLFVATEHQGKGLASILWRHVADNLSARQYVGAVTVNSSLEARPIYEHFGFKATASVQHTDGVAYIPMSVAGVSR